MTDQEIIDKYDPKELLLLVLKGMEVAIHNHDGKYVEVENGYSIEVEGKSLYKLLHKGQVVAPFADVVEMCGFIKMG
ncbi:MAG: hypothetical protein IPK35_21545 [Saprospiraceae bacterium]|jgi:hypothetical protein|nr:hypothetical protein [Saprospiraceae bacterium]